jgi:hypothetical protein
MYGIISSIKVDHVYLYSAVAMNMVSKVEIHDSRALKAALYRPVIGSEAEQGRFGARQSPVASL